MALYRKLREAGTFATPVISQTRLRIDTERVASGDAAAQIIAAL